MAKVERETIKHFKFVSKMKDVGNFHKSFILKRRTASLDMQHVNTKSVLTRGMLPADDIDAQKVDTIATLMVYFKPIDDNGKIIKKEVNGQFVDNTDWIEDVMDPDIFVALHREWMDYQQSFYVSDDADKKDSPPVQG